MNPRERKLLIALVTVVGLGVAMIAVWMWFIVPLRAHNLKIAAMTLENAKTQDQVDEFDRGRRKLMLARLKSLPASPSEARSEYLNFLQSILPKSGMRVEEVTSQDNAAEVKMVSNIPGIKKVGHQMMIFQVRARGTMAQLVSALEAMRNTPYEHRIKTLNIDRADNTTKDSSAKLIVNMIIETLLVAKTENKPGVPPGVDVKFALFDSMAALTGGPTGLGQSVATLVLRQTERPESNRHYADIARRNFFVGAIPAPPKRPPPKPQPEYKPPEPKPPGPMFLTYIRLTQIEPTSESANFLNLYYDKDEQKISAKENSGYNTFLVAARDPDPPYTFFLAKVLRVDSREVFFQVKDKVYQWHVGETLKDAYEDRPWLTLDIMDAIDLEPDFAWAKMELEKEKAKETTKTSKTTKKTTKGR